MHLAKRLCLSKFWIWKLRLLAHFCNSTQQVVGKGGINWLSLDLLSFLLLPHARREPDSSQSETSRTLSPSSSIFLQLFVHRPILHLPAPSQSWPWVIGIPLPGPCMDSDLTTILECRPFAFRFIWPLGCKDIIMLHTPLSQCWC